MKLDATDLRYLTSEEFRVLTAVEMGSKNHEVVPTALIGRISGLRNGGVNKLLGSLAKRNLIAKVQNTKYDGYRLTYGGYDYLAMRALSKRDSMQSVGNQIGVGKESDIYIVADGEGNQLVLKLHRLGRISFRAVKSKRDYMGKRKSASWMYMSRLAAQKEWAFLKVLYEHDFPVPKPIDQARHCVLMEFIDAFPLRQISDIASPGRLYSKLMDIIVRFARAGLIHGDFNEFNILVRQDSGEPVVIDFPQMVSTSHENAEWYFNRDVECIRTFFLRRFRYGSSLYPRFRSTITGGETKEGDEFRLDVMVAASGFAHKESKALEEYMDALKLRDNTEGPVEEVERLSDDEEGGEEEDEEGDEEEEKEKEGEEGEEEEEEVNEEGEEEKVEEEEMEEKEASGQNNHYGDRRDLEVEQSNEVESDEAADPHATRVEAGDVLKRSWHDSHSQITREITTAHTNETLPSAPSESFQDISSHPPGRPPTSPENIRSMVVKDLSKQRAKQNSKFSSKRSTNQAGRPQGSKAKQDQRVRLDKNGIWE